MSEIKNFVVSCLSELIDGSVAYKTISHAYTKEELINEVQQGTDVGKTYCSDLFRVSRDLIVRKNVKS